MNEIDLLLDRIDKLNEKIKCADNQNDKIEHAYEIYRVIEAIEAVRNIS